LPVTAAGEKGRDMDTIQNVRKAIAAYYTSYFHEHGATMEGAAWGSDL